MFSWFFITALKFEIDQIQSFLVLRLAYKGLNSVNAWEKILFCQIKHFVWEFCEWFSLGKTLWKLFVDYTPSEYIKCVVLR